MSSSPALSAADFPVKVKPSLRMMHMISIVTIALAWFVMDQFHLGISQDPLHRGVLAVGAGVSLAAILYALLRRYPRVTLDRRGVTIRNWKGGPAAWDEIERVWQRQRVSQGQSRSVTNDVVCMALKQPQRQLDRVGPVTRKMIEHYSAQGYGDLYFSTSGTDGNAEALVALIQSMIGTDGVEVPHGGRSGVPG